MNSFSPCRLAVLLSGTGSTLENFYHHIERGTLPAEICVVVASRHSAFGLTRAQARGTPTRVLTRGAFKSDGRFDAEQYATELVGLLAPFSPQLVVLAGFMTRIAAPVLNHYDVMNVHPALLPQFGGPGCYGHHVHRAVLDAGVAKTGATVHFVDEAYDHGPIISQATTDVRANDTPETLAQRVQALERDLYPQAIRWFAEGRLVRSGNRVSVR